MRELAGTLVSERSFFRGSYAFLKQTTGTARDELLFCNGQISPTRHRRCAGAVRVRALHCSAARR